MIKAIPVTTLPIRLGQFLKLASAVQDGLEAKLLIANAEVKVNNKVELRRGRQLSAGDYVELYKTKFIVTAVG